MKKYGLNLRIPPGLQKQKTSKPPIAPPAFAFKDDDDDDVEKDISRQAAKNRANEKVEEMHKRALEEDPNVFDYDGHYDEMKEKIARPRIQDKTERKSKYIEILKQKAKEREREHEIIYEKKILKERSQEDHLFADKEKFVTKAYKEKLAERAKWMEEERLRQIREAQEDVTKKKDLSDFYFGLDKNVAFGARTEESSKPLKQEGAASGTQAAECSSKSEATIQSSHTDKVHVQGETHYPSESRTRDAAMTPEVPEDTTPKNRTRDAATPPEVLEDTTTPKSLTRGAATTCEVPEDTNTPEGSSRKRDRTEEEPPKQTAEAYKRAEDAVAAARERYLARKKAREQL